MRRSPLPRPTKPLNRRTPLRSVKGLARSTTRLKPASPRKVHWQRREALKERETWSRQWTCCMVCLRRLPLDTHEIVPRSRAAACFVLANLLAVCRFCHDMLQGWLPVVVQCAFKLLGDPEHYDLQEVNRLRNRAEDSITHGQVKLWSGMIQAMRGEAA